MEAVGTGRFDWLVNLTLRVYGGLELRKKIDFFLFHFLKVTLKTRVQNHSFRFEKMPRYRDSNIHSRYVRSQ